MKYFFEITSFVFCTIGILYIAYLLIQEISKLFKRKESKEKLILYLMVIIILIGIIEDKAQFFGWI